MGVTLLEADDEVDVPLILVAATVNVYEVPFVSPETVIGEDPVPVSPPGEDVAVNVVIAEPPVSPDVYVTVAFAFPDVAVPIVGACGTVVAVMLDVASDAADVAVAFVPVTVNV
jgi:hypothetical protein